MVEIVKIGRISSSSSIDSFSSIFVIVLARGYRVNFVGELPSEIYVSPNIQLMKASTVANQGLRG